MCFRLLAEIYGPPIISLGRGWISKRGVSLAKCTDFACVQLTAHINTAQALLISFNVENSGLWNPSERTGRILHLVHELNNEGEDSQTDSQTDRNKRKLKGRFWNM